MVLPRPSSNVPACAFSGCTSSIHSWYRASGWSLMKSSRCSLVAFKQLSSASLFSRIISSMSLLSSCILLYWSIPLRASSSSMSMFMALSFSASCKSRNGFKANDDTLDMAFTADPNPCLIDSLSTWAICSLIRAPSDRVRWRRACPKFLSLSSSENVLCRCGCSAGWPPVPSTAERYCQGSADDAPLCPPEAFLDADVAAGTYDLPSIPSAVSGRPNIKLSFHKRLYSEFSS
mmetsp:Transcript_26582/g.63731  ORF Transcript_26582/g.63731 Transcript_26582/m.63731 type:complete len:233 (-) Transcript_26582:99-797(-)